MIPYLIELTIIHSLISLGYFLFLRNEQHYRLMRGYLLGSIPVAMVIPVIPFDAFISVFPAGNTGAEYTGLVTYALEPVTIGAQSAFNSFLFLKWIYLAIAFWLFSSFLVSLLRIIHIFIRSTPAKVDGVAVRIVPGIKGSFTFFKWIFISREEVEEGVDFAPIIEHELAHSRLVHTSDVIITHLFRVFCWFLPSAWWLQKEIKKIHEYEADQFALRKFSLTDYSNVLVSHTLKTNGWSLANSFHDGLISKRLRAMKNQVTKINHWKMMAVGIFCAIVIVTFACNDELDAEIRNLGENATEVWEIPEESLGTLQQLEEKHGVGNVKYIEVFSEDGVQRVASINEQLKEHQVYVDLVLSVNIMKDGERLGIFLKKGKELDYASAQLMQLRENEVDSSGEPVFTIVEHQPEFPGGFAEFYSYISENLKYPEEARQDSVEGRVFVQFVVDKDGSVIDVQSVKGIGHGCDQEAERVMKASPKFIPGKQSGQHVKVRMVLPVIFKLD